MFVVEGASGTGITTVVVRRVEVLEELPAAGTPAVDVMVAAEEGPPRFDATTENV